MEWDSAKPRPAGSVVLEMHSNFGSGIWLNTVWQSLAKTSEINSVLSIVPSLCDYRNVVSFSSNACTL